MSNVVLTKSFGYIYISWGGTIPYHLGNPSEDDSHTMLAKTEEVSMGKAPYSQDCLTPTLQP